MAQKRLRNGATLGDVYGHVWVGLHYHSGMEADTMVAAWNQEQSI